jgi:hypothetical protein
VKPIYLWVASVFGEVKPIYLWVASVFGEVKPIYLWVASVFGVLLLVWMLWPAPKQARATLSPHELDTEELVAEINASREETTTTPRLAHALELNKRADRPPETEVLVKQQLFNSFSSPSLSDRKAALLAVISNPNWADSPGLKDLTQKTAEELNRKFGNQVFRVYRVGDEMRITADFKMSPIK